MSIPEPEQLACPFPECGEQLAIVYSGTFPIHTNDVARGGQIDPDDATGQHWSVDCAAGHTVLVPGPTGCDCSDHEEGAVCPIEDHFDWGDEFEHRTFRAHDWSRLRRVLDLMRPDGS